MWIRSKKKSSGGGGTGASLIVTCDSNFAGSTISCTDGITTYTETCPSSSPYIVTFTGLSTGTWTVSGIISGHTYTNTKVITDFECDLLAIVELNNVSFDTAYNAANSYVTAGIADYKLTMFDAWSPSSSNHDFYWSTRTDIVNLGSTNMTNNNNTRPLTLENCVIITTDGSRKDSIQFLEDGYIVLCYLNTLNYNYMSQFKNEGNIYHLQKVSAGDIYNTYSHYSSGGESCWLSYYTFK